MGCNHDCDSCGGSCGEPESLLKAPHPLSKIKKVIGVVSGKGGVGKSHGHLSARRCHDSVRALHCGILDADITGPSIPKGFGLTRHTEVQQRKAFTRWLRKTGIVQLMLHQSGAAGRRD